MKLERPDQHRLSKGSGRARTTHVSASRARPGRNEPTACWPIYPMTRR